MTPLDFLLGQPWALSGDHLQDLLEVFGATPPQALAARAGEPMEGVSYAVRNGVAVLPVKGVIARRGNWLTDLFGMPTTERLARDYQAALDDPAIHAVALDIDSPGGQASGISELAGMIRAGSARKPTVAYVGSLAASAGYWLASAAQEIVAHKTAQLGSIGVIQPVRVTGDKRTIEFVSSQSPNKNPDPKTDAGRAQIQETVDALAGVFIDSVAEYRGKKPEQVINDFGSGGVKVGRHAVASGMADRLGSLEGVIKELAQGTRGGAAVSSPILPGRAAVAHHKGPVMKLDVFKFLTGWMQQGSPAVIDVSEVPEAQAEEAAQEFQAFKKDVKWDGPAPDPEVAKLKAELESLRAEVRNSRDAGYKAEAEAFLSLHGDAILPAERDKLISAYVAAARIDHEAGTADFSVLQGFKAGIAARKPHHLGGEFVPTDAGAGDLPGAMRKAGLKVMDNAHADPGEAEAAASASRIESMLKATEVGRQVLGDTK
jgi:ClpP class serine protease